MNSSTMSYALGQLRRHQLRSFLTMFGTAFSVFACIVVFAFAQGVMNLWKDGVFDTGTGHIHILSVDQEGLLKKSSELESLLSSHNEIEAYSTRIHSESLGISDYATTYIQTIGIDPIHEVLVSPRLFYPGFDEGRFVQNVGDAVIARGLVKMLQLHIGDSLTLVANTIDGSSNAVDLKVVGIIDIPLPGFSQHSVYMHIDQLASLIRTQDQVTRYTLRLFHPQHVARVMDQLKSNGSRVVPWWESYPLVFNIERIWLFVAGLLCGLLALCAFMSIANIFMIMLYERRREIATLRTLGIGFSKIQNLLLADAAILSGLGILVGILTSFVFLIIQRHYGVAFESPFGGGVMRIQPHLDLGVIFIVTALAMALAYLAILHATSKNRRLQLSVLIKS